MRHNLRYHGRQFGYVARYYTTWTCFLTVEFVFRTDGGSLANGCDIMVRCNVPKAAHRHNGCELIPASFEWLKNVGETDHKLVNNNTGEVRGNSRPPSQWSAPSAARSAPPA